MKITPAFLMILATGYAACNTATSTGAKAKINYADSQPPAKVAPVVAVANDTLIRMQFKRGDTGIIASAQGYMNGDNPVICEVTINKADSLHATVMPEGEKGNVRISQIILPDGKMDGPFGNELRYATPQTGTYKIRIFENRMAGDKWKGKFKIKVWVK